MPTIPFEFRCDSCAQCGTTNTGQPACAKHKIAVNPKKDGCTWHTNKGSTSCVFCGDNQNLIIYSVNDVYYPVCAAHSQYMYKCQTCQHSDECSFAADHSAPQVIMKTVRQGMMTMQTQVRNPELVIKHCPTCKCGQFNQADQKSEPICLKETVGECPNWQVKTTLLQ